MTVIAYALRAALAVLLAVASLAAAAHEISMAEIQVRETQPGRFLWHWTAASRGGTDALRVQWPDQCVDDGTVLRCGEDGLKGTVSVDGIGKEYSAVLLKVFWADGQSRVYSLAPGQPTVRLFGAADDRRTLGEIARVYTVLGFEHILGGIDHLLFVTALLFLVGFNRRLVWTITAFTAAHSITLALSALGWLTLRSPPVEATIALSIVLVAGEALHREQTFARRWPALVAFLFGLVHGLGFAGALKEIGLPEQHLAAALFTFNVGVELGQLAAVGVAYAAYRLLSGRSVLVLARAPALYAIGGIAGFWSISRALAIFA